jgi:DNA-binding LacI/PurR family transcriptional regulator
MREMKFIARKRVPQIGILVSNLSGAKLTSYISQLLRLTMLELVRRDCVIRLLNGELEDWGLDDHFDAIISLAYDESVNRLMSEYPAPVISLNNPLAASCLYEIHSDHRQSARIATEYLLTMGHRNIMMICYKKSGRRHRGLGDAGTDRRIPGNPRKIRIAR